jgi:hypothetical protein
MTLIFAAKDRSVAMNGSSNKNSTKIIKPKTKMESTLSERKASKSPLMKPKQLNNDTLEFGNGSEKRKKADPDYVSPTPEEMINNIEKDMKLLKSEVKTEFKVMMSAEEDLQKAIKDAKAKKREDQLEKLKGKELLKIEHLHRLGFTNEVMTEHLKKENEMLQKNVKTKEKEVQNAEANIEKMVQLNGDSEKAVTAALSGGNQLRVNQQKLKAKLDQAELELYSEENIVKHKRGMRGVEITKKSDFKKTLEGVVKIVMQRCEDKRLVGKVLKVAGKCLSHDAGLNDSFGSISSSDDDDMSSSSSSASSSNDSE